jgi:hypothetical protein
MPLHHRLASPDPARTLVIVDVRPKLNAVANQAKGKGYESAGVGTNYPAAALHFMNGAQQAVALSMPARARMRVSGGDGTVHRKSLTSSRGAWAARARWRHGLPRLVPPPSPRPLLHLRGHSPPLCAAPCPVTCPSSGEHSLHARVPGRDAGCQPQPPRNRRSAVRIAARSGPCHGAGRCVRRAHMGGGGRGTPRY